MSVSELSASSQNYLKAIWSLGEWNDDPVTPSVLAARIGVRLSTVSDAVRKLADQGLVEHTPYGSVSLTDEGRIHAIAMIRRHRLIEAFLVQTLGYRWDQVHDEAETLEHAVSDFMVDRIDELLGFPKRDPHGDPIPSADGTLEMPAVEVLSALAEGARGRIERISDSDPGLLQFFADRGVGVGAVVELRAGAPYSESMELIVDGLEEPLVLGRAATDAVWMSAVVESTP